MTNRIKEIRVFEGRLDPAEAEVCIAVYSEALTSTTQVRGRLMGPSCLYATTVEVAYPLRELSREYESLGTPHITVRALIPEPNLWTPATPFLYRGVVELWQGGQCCERVPITRGLRGIKLGARGLRVNGQPVIIRGLACARCSEEDASRLHQAGCNTLLVPPTAESAGLWELGDRYGFLMLGKLSSWNQVDQAGFVPRHPSILGWVLEPEFFRHPLLVEDPSLATSLLPRYATEEPLAGMALPQSAAAASVPPGVSFVLGTEETLAALAEINLPTIVLSARPFGEPLPAAGPDVLGWIHG
jgi:hypothetical protein